MPASALRELLALAEWPDPEPGEVAIVGDDPVFPTRYRIGTAGAAALAAVGIAVSELWALRSGRRQHVAVDLRAAAASLRSNRYLRIDGEKPAEPWDRLSGFYPVRDGGWITLHCNFPHHRAAALAVLGAAPERGAVGEATLSWAGEALEDAIHAAGGCAGWVRSPEDWARHPQAQAIGLQPLLCIEQIAESEPEPLPSGTRPLAGIRVVDLTRVLAGPTCARTLAEHGADVLKITAGHLPDSGPIELDTGIGKRAARLDLRRPPAIGTLRGLVREADVFSQSYRPGALARRGFSPADVAKLRPGIVYVTLSAWGRSGPWRERRGFDTIVQTVSGMAHLSGDGTRPKLLPVSAIDYVSGYLMAFGAMVALARRASIGGSWLVRVALARTGRWIVDRGILDPSRVAGLAEELEEAELARLTAEMPAPAGRIRYLAPVVRLAETPGRWDRPPVPLDHDRPEWEPGLGNQ
ncbi:MAG: CoA transferase [Acetobacteraceae bacterium]|nr:CoA transferase [Acetobacteraceae bacterium]